jgi:hypothetical protein
MLSGFHVQITQHTHMHHVITMVRRQLYACRMRQTSHATVHLHLTHHSMRHMCYVTCYFTQSTQHPR